MEKENILKLITPKGQLAYLTEGMSARQALEKMRAHGFMAIPLISKNGEYIGTISEGDLLWTIVNNECSLQDLSDIKIDSLVRKDYTPPVKVDADFTQITNMIKNQNFVPIIDDRNILMGIITRSKVIGELLSTNTEIY